MPPLTRQSRIENNALLLVFFSSLVMTTALIHLLLRTRIGQVFLAFPTARGLHTSPVPRVGGLAMFGSVWLMAGFWMQRDLVAGIAVLSLVLLTISLIDDLHPLSALLRVLVHAAPAILIVLLWINAYGIAPGRASLPLHWLMTPPGVVAIVMAIVWMTNL